ncbi:MAG: hypothetical protein IKP96_01065 [Elusimicrobiaceae bacterium]|nr:hypothetical protein [Elusimicrobiaceae bacterium]
MFQKLGWFVFLLFIAVMIGLWFPNRYTVIECTNANKICQTYHINSALKMKRLVHSVPVHSARGTSWHVLGVGKSNIKYLSCTKHQEITTRRDGGQVTTTKYLLMPIGAPNALPHHFLHEYLAQTACEVDRAALEAYLSSDRSEPFMYTTGTSWLRYGWYLVSAFFVILAFLVLLKAKVISPEEEKRVDPTIAGKAAQIHAQTQQVIESISNLDKTWADKIKQAGEDKWDIENGSKK